MCRQNNSRAKSSPEEVVSADENLLVYCKPVRLYSILHLRLLCNPLFLSRCLNYKIQAKGKRKLRSAGIVVFNYKDCNNTLQKTEVRENCSCPFCYMLCGNFKGLQLHLNSFHELFEFEFMLSGEYQTVNVSVKFDALGFEEDGNHKDKFEPFSFCSKSRKRRERGGRKKAKRLDVRFLPLDSPNDTENGVTPPKNGNNGGLGYPETTGKFGMTSDTPPPAIAQSCLDSDAKAMLTTETVIPGPATKTRKLSAERSEARSHLLLRKRQFYHSHRVQPMLLEQVMSDRDSEDEVDDDVADIEDRQMLDDFVDVHKDEKKFMHLWNSFARKQRVLADGHVPWACEAFSKFHKQDFLHCSSLFWCWKLFMIKLWNHGLVDATTINNCNSILQNHQNYTGTMNNNNCMDHGHDINSKNIDDMDVDDTDNNNRDN